MCFHGFVFYLQASQCLVWQEVLPADLLWDVQGEEKVRSRLLSDDSGLMNVSLNEVIPSPSSLSNGQLKSLCASRSTGLLWKLRLAHVPEKQESDGRSCRWHRYCNIIKRCNHRELWWTVIVRLNVFALYTELLDGTQKRETLLTRVFADIQEMLLVTQRWSVMWVIQHLRNTEAHLHETHFCFVHLYQHILYSFQ